MEGGGEAEERRIDPDDGNSYTRAEFISCYGSTREWEQAELSPGSKRRAQRRGEDSAQGSAQEEAALRLEELREQLDRMKALVEAGIAQPELVADLERDIAQEEAVLKEEVSQAGRFSGKRIRWQRGTQIGKGSFGTVFMAMDVNTGGLLACKELPCPQGDMVAQSAVQREIQVMCRLRHPNVVALHCAEWMADKVFVLMELVPGGSLRKLITEFGAFQPSVVSLYGRQLVAAVGHLHQEGIVHRDIKASNVLVSDKGIVKLSDFGTSLVADTAAAGTRALEGTVLWLSPEVLHTRRYTWASDVWAVGCTILEMGTGQRPWDSLGLESVESAMYHISRAKDGPPIPAQPPLDESLQDLLRSCWGPEEARATCGRLLEHPFLSEFVSGQISDSDCSDDQAGGEIVSPADEHMNPHTRRPSTKVADHLAFLRDSWKGATLDTSCPSTACGTL